MAIGPEVSCNNSRAERGPRRLPPASSTSGSSAQHHVGPRDDDIDTLIALLGRVAEGEVDAFAALYDLTSARLFGLALSVLRNPQLAQQAILQVYLEVWADAHRFNPNEGSPQAWLTTLTQRHAVDRARHESGRAARMLFCDNGNRVEGCRYTLDEVGHHTACADGDALNHSQRETIALAYYGGLTYQEVAEFLGVSLSTITSRVRTGLKRLDESLRTR